MSISSVGGEASQAWQALKESRAKQAVNGNATGGTAALPPPPKDAPPGALPDGAAAGATGAGGISSASAKVITDLKALFIDLQAGNASSTAGSTDAGSAGTASSSAAATSANASGASAADTSAGVQSDLKTLFGDLSKVGGHGGHHHGHGKPPTAPSATDSTGATAGTAASGAAPDSAAAKPSGSLFDQLAGALKAYAASSLGNSTTSNPTGSATALLSA